MYSTLCLQGEPGDFGPPGLPGPDGPRVSTSFNTRTHVTHLVTVYLLFNNLYRVLLDQLESPASLVLMETQVSPEMMVNPDQRELKVQMAHVDPTGQRGPREPRDQLEMMEHKVLEVTLEMLGRRELVDPLETTVPLDKMAYLENKDLKDSRERREPWERR